MKLKLNCCSGNTTSSSSSSSSSGSSDGDETELFTQFQNRNKSGFKDAIECQVGYREKTQAQVDEKYAIKTIKNAFANSELFGKFIAITIGVSILLGGVGLIMDNPFHSANLIKVALALLIMSSLSLLTYDKKNYN